MTANMMWAQAGVYNAPDDRAVITALSGGNTGTVKPPVLTAGSGLTINVPAGWLAIASCGDGTNCVIGSHSAVVVTGTAGPSSGSRLDYLWADVDATAGTWSLAVRAATSVSGRAGVALAQITVPAGASSAAQMQFQQSPLPTYASFVGSRLGLDAPTSSVTLTGGISGANSPALASVTFTLASATGVLVTAFMQGAAVITGTAQRRVDLSAVIDGTVYLLNGGYPSFGITIGISGVWAGTLAAGSHTVTINAYAQNVNYTVAGAGSRHLSVTRVA
jgi:hypothetical protein